MLSAIKNILLSSFYLKNKFYSNKEINLENIENINFWSKKLKVSKSELHDAILYTGSININDLQLYLKKVKKKHSFFFEFRYTIKAK